MALTVARFLSLLFAALALAPALAHLLELPNKIGLPRDAYLIVQHIYYGWAPLTPGGPMPGGAGALRGEPARARCDRVEERA